MRKQAIVTILVAILATVLSQIAYRKFFPPIIGAHVYYVKSAEQIKDRHYRYCTYGFCFSGWQGEYAIGDAVKVEVVKHKLP